MSDSKPRSPVRPLRQFFVRSTVLAVLLAAAAVFGSRAEVSCQRPEGQVDCQVTQGVDLPWGAGAVPLWKQEVRDVRDTRWERQSPGRDVSQPQTTVQPRDVVLLIGRETLEVGWLGASGPVAAFLRSNSRTEMSAVEPLDRRGWLVSRTLLGFAALVLLDSLIILLFGNARINQWLGPREDPDAPLPTTGLAKLAPVIVFGGAAALIAFFFVGYRFVGPLAEHKVAALHEAAAEGDRTALEAVLDRGVSVHAVEEASGRTALHLGARTPEIAELLLERGADPNAFDSTNRTPLHQAASWGGIRSVSALLERGAEPDAMDDSGWTPLRRASSVGDLDSVKALLAAGSDPESQGPHGWTPLHDASAGGHPEIVEILLAAGADHRVRNENGHVPGDLAPDPEVRDLLAQREALLPEA